MAAAYQLRTVDVWDTLIRRHCHPECIKLSLAQHVYLRFQNVLRETFQDPHSLYLERIAVEAALAGVARAEGKDDEYELDAVLAEWLTRVFPAGGWTPGLNKELAEVEFSLECERSFPDEEIAAVLAEYPAEKTIFLSDFYMDAGRLQRLLTHHGWQDVVSSGISSCDVGLNKRSGRLFSHVQATFNVQPSNHVHIGDNAHSDVAMPTQRGITAVSFLPQAGHSRREANERLFASRSDLFSFLQETALVAAQQECPANNAFHSGVQAAPLFIGFALFIAESSVSDKVKRVYFQTREGEFFLRIYQALFPDMSLAGIRLAPVSLLEVSRLSTFAASLRSSSSEELLRVWRLVQRQSMGALFQTLGLSIDKHLDVLGRCGLTPEEVINAPENDVRVKKLLADAEFAQELLAHAERKRALLQDYLKQEGVLDAGAVGLVDIGWRGTIQDNLALVAPQVHLSGYYLGLQRYLNPQPASVSKAAFGPNGNLELASIKLLDAVAPLEIICNSDKGSVEGYLRSDRGIEAVRAVNAEENQTYEQFSESFQRGVIFAVQKWQPYIRNYAVASADLRKVALRTWEALCENSSEEMVSACLAAPQSDIFGFGDFFDKKDIPSLRDVFLGIFQGQKRRSVIQYIKRSQWPASIRTRQDIGEFHRMVILSLFFLARKYKNLRLKYMYFKAYFGAKK